MMLRAGDFGEEGIELSQVFVGYPRQSALSAPFPVKIYLIR